MISLVIPTIRDLKFLKEWEDQFRENPKLEIIIVEDHEKQTINCPTWDNITIYSHKAIRKDLGKDAWIIPIQSDGIRSYGFLKAKGDIIITLDDDCYPSVYHDFLDRHEGALNLKMCNNFYNIFNHPTIQPRGYPYGIREKKKCVLNLGLWDESPDFDAPTELYLKHNIAHIPYNNGIVNTGLLVPICIMNVAFRGSILPAYYQLPSGPYSRFHDIWSGFIIKKIIDYLGDCMSVGEPYIDHFKKSNTFTNLIKESKGIQANEVMWKVIDSCTFQGTTYAQCYNDMAFHFTNTVLKHQDNQFNNELIDYLFICSKAMQIWLKLCEKR